MGYQEYLIKVTDNNMEKTAGKIEEKLNNTDSSYNLDYVSTLKSDVKIYEYGKTADDWRYRLHKGDKFLVLQGDRGECAGVLRGLSNPSFEAETIMRCASEQGLCSDITEYDKIFDDETLDCGKDYDLELD